MFWGRVERGPHLTQSRLGRGLAPYHTAIWSQQIWAENWGAVLLWGGGSAGSPSNTLWPGPRPTCMPSFILISPTVWPQCTNVTDRKDRQTDRTDRQRTDSIGEPFYKRSPNNASWRYCWLEGFLQTKAAVNRLRRGILSSHVACVDFSRRWLIMLQ